MQMHSVEKEKQHKEWLTLIGLLLLGANAKVKHNNTVAPSLYCNDLINIYSYVSAVVAVLRYILYTIPYLMQPLS